MERRTTLAARRAAGARRGEEPVHAAPPPPGATMLTAHVHERHEGPEGPGRSRRFRDSQGRGWTVAEEPTPAEEWTSADEETWRAGYPVGWLSFTCGALRKRLRLFPTHWRLLPDSTLEQLCGRALVAGRHD